ncbi:MAG: hypothetical protein ACFFCS_20010 [Candidatus Hodarchaeota archaeon]
MSEDRGFPVRRSCHLGDWSYEISRGVTFRRSNGRNRLVIAAYID